MTASIVNMQSTSGSYVSSLSVTMPSVTAGHLLVAVILMEKTGSRTFTCADDVNGAWTLVNNYGTTQVVSISYYASSVAGQVIVTATPSITTNFHLVVFELAGVDALYAAGYALETINNYSHPCCDPAIDTPAESVILTASQCVANPGTITPAAGYTNEYNDFDNLVQSRVSSSALSSQDGAWTGTTARVASSNALVIFYDSSGSSSTSINLSGSVSSIASSQGEISKSGQLSGDVSALLDASGIPSLTRALSGDVAGVCSAVGQAAIKKYLMGTSEGVAAAAGQASVKKQMAGSSTAIADTAGHLIVSKGFAGVVNADASISSAMSVTKNLSGSSIAIGDTQGGLSVSKKLAGSAGAIAEVQGQLSLQGTIRLAGSVGATAAASGQLSVYKQLTGIAAAIAGASGQITITQVGTVLYLSGTVSAQAGAAGSMSVSKKLSGSISAIADAAGAVMAKINLSGDVDAIATAAGELSLLADGGLGIVIDPSIESITVKRLIDSITKKYTIHSL